MRRTRLSLAALALAALVPAAAHATEGFVFGIEPSVGGWSADPEQITAGSTVSQENAAAFTNPLTAKTRYGVHLHTGWNILGHAALEATFQTSMWDVTNGSRGGVGMAGGRATWFPTQLFLPENLKKTLDLGLELGGGYTIGGGPDFGMDGTFIEYGAVIEYYPVRWFSLGLLFRQYRNNWDKFIFDYDNNVTAPVKDFTAVWNTLGLALNFHVGSR